MREVKLPVKNQFAKAQTIKLHGRPIRKFDAKMMRLIYTIYSKIY